MILLLLRILQHNNINNQHKTADESPVIETKVIETISDNNTTNNDMNNSNTTDTTNNLFYKSILTTTSLMMMTMINLHSLSLRKISPRL